ncbi:MAG: thiol:disulfide interchange protein DsbD [Patiriisocius sp.]|jgi:thiol:disulfide interchange protein DsbD
MSFQSLFRSVFAFLLISTAFGSQSAEFGQHNTLGRPDILPVDEAFNLTVMRTAGQLNLLWQIQPGYYLYRHRINVKGSDRLEKPIVPAGIGKSDEYFGDVEVYYESLQVDVPVAGKMEEEIQVEYQGCAEVGVCYPPQKRTFIVKV